MAALVFGDAEAAVCAILAASADPVVGAATIAADLIDFTAGDRWVRVIRTGGVPTPWQGTDNPLIELASYGPDKGAALDLANAARRTVLAGRGYIGHGLLLYDVADDPAGLAWSPDEKNPALARYVASLALVTKPA